MLGALAESVFLAKYSMDGTEEWPDTAKRVATNVLAAIGMEEDNPTVARLTQLIVERKFLPGGRYLYASGRPFHQTQNCLLLRAEDSKEGWAGLMDKATVSLMSGAGIGVDYSDVRARGTAIHGTGGFATGPCSLMQMVNEAGRHIMGGGSRRAAIWAGLSWDHPDIWEFITLKDWAPALRDLKAEDHDFPLAMELTNISVILDDEFFIAYLDGSHVLHTVARRVYDHTVKRMLKTAEPGFSVNVGENSGESLRNACTEVTSRDDSDICNLGSINMGAVESIEEFTELVDLGTLFLLAGTVYSDLPYEKVSETRTKNRRLGLGLMGLHEWLLKRGKPYGPDGELAEWLEIYTDSTEISHRQADALGLSRPVKTRAIAPTGTIGIIGETTTGIEPIFCVAYIRRWLSPTMGWVHDYVVDPTAKKLIDQGIDPDSIEDAYSISPQRRIEFQSWVQMFVDHGISSTINLPATIEDEVGVQAFGSMLMTYLPQLRGITVYPDGARAGQPIVPIPYSEAYNPLVEESDERCVGGACGV